MADQVNQNYNFREAITDPVFFIGRNDLIGQVQQFPSKVWIILGGRRIGKTSTLNAIQWKLLSSEPEKSRAFPVLINLQVERPESLNNLLYILIARLRESLECWNQSNGNSLRESYLSYLRQIASVEAIFNFFESINIQPENERSKGERYLSHDDFRLAFLKTLEELRNSDFWSICFLLDGADYIAHQKSWANDAWSYLRGLKDTETAIKPFLGLVLSGYRELKEYQQEVGSELLNIAETQWLYPLTELEVSELIYCRMEGIELVLTEQDICFIKEWAGNHPYLIQRILDVICNSYDEKTEISGNKIVDEEHLIETLLYHHAHDFSAWWNEGSITGGFGDNERLVYRALIELRKGTTANLAQKTQLSRMKVKVALDVLLGTGVISKINREYAIGSRLFEEWVTGV
ncbi:MAG: ATP-binding protein [Cyanothece sp. SIO1E1]|nr:ATP-binding protein [Cyanothece sp. SIO1E1]